MCRTEWPHLVLSRAARPATVSGDFVSKLQYAGLPAMLAVFCGAAAMFNAILSEPTLPFSLLFTESPLGIGEGAWSAERRVDQSQALPFVVTLLGRLVRSPPAGVGAVSRCPMSMVVSVYFERRTAPVADLREVIVRECCSESGYPGFLCAPSAAVPLSFTAPGEGYPAVFAFELVFGLNVVTHAVGV
ncbi:MAG: hypothetical protein BWY85_00149 [Firmicutes bacterium ADurb.Bin506]|nr:MAG: hypothetical protein BWY85_00149 [Firmicutes bacterium ADurb.Bin506]